MALSSAGNLRHKVLIKSYVQTTDEVGGQTAIESTSSAWMSVKPMTGSRALQYEQIINGTPFEIICRYFDGVGISVGDVLVYNSENLKIHSQIAMDDDYVKFLAVRRKT